MGFSRHDRLARVLIQREAAGYGDPCFQLFLWYPLPDGNWGIVIDSDQEYHATLWKRRGRWELAKAWGLSINDVPIALEPGFIPTGYVDFEDVRGREVMSLIIPSILPEPWTVSKLKEELRCGFKIRTVKPTATRNVDLELVGSYETMFHNLRGNYNVQSSRY